VPAFNRTLANALHMLARMPSGGPERMSRSQLTKEKHHEEATYVSDEHVAGSSAYSLLFNLCS
jgi:hypothetical protein